MSAETDPGTPVVTAVEVQSGEDRVDPQVRVIVDDYFDHKAWARLTDAQLGINVVDPDGHQIGMARAKKWVPVDGYKHILVGRLDEYSFYNPSGPFGIFDSDEADFNLNIDPSPDFQFILNDVVTGMTQDEQEELVPLSAGVGHAVQCEITPDEEYYDNRWFPSHNFLSSPVVGKNVGVYGPWVGDSGHKGRPEIHPCEVIWWRSASVSRLANGRPVLWRILVLQDDSNRFDRWSDYDGRPSRPWSMSPRRARITVALLGLRGHKVNYNIHMRDGLRIFDWPGEDVRSSTRTLADSQVTVTKVMSRRSEVKMRLSQLATDPANPQLLHCFLRLDIRIGEGDRGDEGFAELLIEARPPAI